MPATTAWDETTPAGTQLASSIDNWLRDTKLDVRERMGICFKWGVSTIVDGYMLQAALQPADNTSAIICHTPNSLTGGNAQPWIYIQQTWNTSAAPTLIMAHVTDTASHANAKLMELIVNGLSKFAVQKDGTIWQNGNVLFSAAGSIGEAQIIDGTILARVAANEQITGSWWFHQPLIANITGNAITVSNGVYTVGDQTINGVKTFTSTINANISGTAAGSAGAVLITGDQVINGTKTFVNLIGGSVSGTASNITSHPLNQTVQAGSSVIFGHISAGSISFVAVDFAPMGSAVVNLNGAPNSTLGGSPDGWWKIDMNGYDVCIPVWAC
jgi:hypothetical protein